ncbi:MAG TPA: rRNA adenine dimethyltransferase family protein [Planctomycetota bacterium]|nr:rRNA adenine dimethyltransferase family protein [Planctomycetota bacterium]
MNWTRTAVTQLLRERGISLKRSLGQNYLVDENFLDALVRDAEVGPGDVVVEIGSGLGNLTERLAARASRVIAIELDEAIHALSKELAGGRSPVTWIRGDGADFARHAPDRIKVVSNLPYGDWTRILLAILAAPMEIESCTLMIQTDVYDRLRAATGTREYGPVPALVQATCSLKRLRKAGKDLFFPAPRVESTVFRLLRPRPVPDALELEGSLRELFAQRRKKSAVAGGRRVEALPPSELLALARQARP